jgi:hypothetical protein
MLNARLLLAAVALLPLAGSAMAGATTPTLLVASATVVGSGAARTVTFDVAYDYENAVQADYEIELVVFQGRDFARYPISGTARVGSSAALDDGLAAADLPALDAAATPAPATVRPVVIAADRVTVSLPASFAPGSATVAFVATVEEGVVLSNPLDFTLP